MAKMGDLTEHFSRHEFMCKCGCGFGDVKGRLLVTLEVIREHAGKPVVMISGCRCKKHNDSLPNSAPNSAHITGEGADIRVPGIARLALGNMIKELWAKGLLPYLEYCYLIAGSKTNVHVGVDKKVRKSKFAF